MSVQHTRKTNANALGIIPTHSLYVLQGHSSCSHHLAAIAQKPGVFGAMNVQHTRKTNANALGTFGWQYILRVRK